MPDDELYGAAKRKAQVARLLDEAKRCEDEVALEAMVGEKDTSHLLIAAREMKALARIL